MIALYEHALTRWANKVFSLGNPTEAVFMVNATALSAEFRAWEMRDTSEGSEDSTPVPTVTAVKIHSAIRAGFVPSLFIEELDKFKLDSDFQRKEFNAIIDAIHNGGGQIVATSNLGDDFLIERLGSQVGGGIVRRLVGPKGNEGVAYEEVGDKIKYSAPDPSQGGFYIDFWRSTIEQNRQIALPDEPGFAPVVQKKGTPGRAVTPKEPVFTNPRAHGERVVNKAAAGHAPGLSITSDGRQQFG